MLCCFLFLSLYLSLNLQTFLISALIIVRKFCAFNLWHTRHIYWSKQGVAAVVAAACRLCNLWLKYSSMFACVFVCVCSIVWHTEYRGQIAENRRQPRRGRRKSVKLYSLVCCPWFGTVRTNFSFSLSLCLSMCGDSMHFFMSSEGKGGVGKGAALRLWLHAANKFSLAPEKRFNLRFWTHTKRCEFRKIDKNLFANLLKGAWQGEEIWKVRCIRI